MKTRITESTLLFISIVKWVTLATVAGAIVGTGTALFLKALNISEASAASWDYYYLLLPAAFCVSAAMVAYLAPDAEGHGTEKVIEAVHKKAAKIPLPVVPVKLAATIVTLAFGGSAGKEGPCAQIGAGMTSFMSKLLNFSDHDRKKLVICGISAGFAAVFGTPIAGAIFGVEVLFIGAILYEVLLPSFIAGITAYQVSTSMGITYFHRPLSFAPVFSETFMLKVMLSGVFFGLAALVLIEVLHAGHWISKKIKTSPPVKGLIGGAVLALLALILSTRYLGLGLDHIEDLFGGTTASWYDFLIKSAFTSITLNFGGSGGIVTPIFFIGASVGNLYAQLLHLDLATFSAIGFVSVLAGAANTPIAASIMAVELFGPVIAPYATIACIISFLMSGNKSVYPSQVLSIRKAESINVELGKELESMKDATYSPNPNSTAALAVRLINKIDELTNKRRH